MGQSDVVHPGTNKWFVTGESEDEKEDDEEVDDDDDDDDDGL